MPYQKLIKITAILLIVVLSVVILVYAKPFLVPITIAALLSMLLLPLSKKLESKGVNKAVSILLCILLLLIFLGGFMALVSWQISDIADNAHSLEQEITKKSKEIQDLIAEKLGVSRKKQQEMMNGEQPLSPSKLSGVILGFLKGLGGLLTDTLLVLVYIFLFMYFRMYFKRFLIEIVSPQQQTQARTVLHDAPKVAQQYLTGLSLMVVMLWVMYSIGFSLAGVKNPIFFAILCGMLEIVPFIGNLTGTTLTLGMSLLQGGDTSIIVYILLTYGCIQFIQTYIIEPMVVGAKVNVNPLFTILGLVAGELVWGIAGMILAIPLMGIAKIICDHVESLRPLGQLIGEDKQHGENFFSKLLKKILPKKQRTPDKA